MTGAVHGFEGKCLFLHFEGEHVLAVVLPVAGGLPQFAVVDVWRHHLLETTFPVFTLVKKKKKKIFFIINHVENLRSVVCCLRLVLTLMNWISVL